MDNLLLYASILFSISHLIFIYVRKFGFKHIYNFWILSYIFFLVVPTIILDVAQQELILLSTKVALSIPLIAMPISITFFDACFKSRNSNFNVIISDNKEGKFVKKFLLICVIISIVAMMFSNSKPLIYALKNSGDFSGLVLSREDARGTVIKVPYIEFWIRQILFPIFVVYFYSIFDQCKSKKNFVRFLLVLGFASFFGFFNLVKSPFVVIVLSLIIYKGISARRIKKISKTVFIYLLLTVGVMVEFLRLFSPGRSMMSIVNALWTRIFYTPASLTNSYIRLFDVQKLLGSSMPFIYKFSSSERFSLANYVYIMNNPFSSYSSGNAPASFIGEGYANFGFAIIIFYSIMISLLLAVSYKFFSESKKTHFMVALYSVLYYSFFELLRTSFFTVLISYGVLLILIMGLYDKKRIR